MDTNEETSVEKEPMQFYFTPCDYSPTYLLESDGNRNFRKIVKIYSVPPDYPDAEEIPIDKHFVDYFENGGGWQKVLKHRDWLNVPT